MRDRNLLVVVQEPKSFILSILPRLTPKVLVPSEHHVLKYLPFYKVAYAMDAKACQDQLEEREKKRLAGR